MKRIKCAAIRHNGKIYEGHSHTEIGLQMLADGACKRPFPGGDAQGFVTDDGYFVGRITAFEIAMKSGQIREGETCHPYELFSEDLKG